MKSILSNNEKLAATVGKVEEVAGYLWQKGWAERNGGNITVNVTEELTEEEKAFERVLFKNSGEILGAVQKGNTKNSFKYVLRRLFPKYASMKFMYPVLKKAPILLPFCYIARVLSLFGNGKFKKGTEQLSAYNNAKDQEIKVFYNAGLKEYLESKHDAM